MLWWLVLAEADCGVVVDVLVWPLLAGVLAMIGLHGEVLQEDNALAQRVPCLAWRSSGYHFIPCLSFLCIQKQWPFLLPLCFTAPPL